MKQKINFLIFIKIAIFIRSIWICHFFIDINTFNKSLDENYIIIGKLNKISYRLLSKCKQDRDSSIVNLIEKIPNNKVNEKKCISNSAKSFTTKNKPSNGNSLRSLTCQKQDIKNNSYILEKKKCSYIEKKIFKELDFENFLKNNKTISNRMYKKAMRKKYGLRILTPTLLFLLLLILMIVDISLGLSIKKSLLIALVKWDPLEVLSSGWFLSLFEKVKSLDWLWKSPLWTTSETLTEGMKKNGLLGRLIGIPMYFLPFLILGVTFIFAILYYHQKVKKYENIKFKKS
ncbi:fam-l protein [Plasmodium malariae]|uniref:Fam-l protein n=1 Tax=Plasmodium malariae TaxID=5858 RepID=A0A1D3JHL9_PLAMA|nr:fam-l protein [Plasmodium malariae]SBT85843.1 fam-l protein [Plasmodium malariae]